jgi:hypothetical protein
MIIPTAAAVMTTKVAQPKYLSGGEFTRLPITLGLLVRGMTSRIWGVAVACLCSDEQLPNRVAEGENDIAFH